jgi:hypothetical protein
VADVDDVDDKVEEAEVNADSAEKAEAEEAEPSEKEGVADDADPTRSEETDAFWAEVRIDPVEIALPRGVGYTLRAYRMSDEVTVSAVTREEDDYGVLDRPAILSEDDEDDDFDLDADEDDVDEDDESDDLDADESEDDESEDEEADEESEDESAAADDEATDDEAPKDLEVEVEDIDDEDETVEAEEVPVFLGHAGNLLLFATAQGLVDFVASDAEHDLAQLPEWAKVRERLTVADVVPAEDDRYELDLVVENLRGGQDVWDTQLLIRAGEIARDLGYGLRIDAILTALASGSPLDDLDEALRSAESGVVGGFFARRRLKKIGAQQAALGWRTIIGKISAAVDWRE